MSFGPKHSRNIACKHCHLVGPRQHVMMESNYVSYYQYDILLSVSARSCWQHDMKTLYALLVFCRGMYRCAFDPSFGWSFVIHYCLLVWSNCWINSRVHGHLRHHGNHVRVPLMYLYLYAHKRLDKYWKSHWRNNVKIWKYIQFIVHLNRLFAITANM